MMGIIELSKIKPLPVKTGVLACESLYLPAYSALRRFCIDKTAHGLLCYVC